MKEDDKNFQTFLNENVIISQFILHKMKSKINEGR